VGVDSITLINFLLFSFIYFFFYSQKQSLNFLELGQDLISLDINFVFVVQILILASARVVCSIVHASARSNPQGISLKKLISI
jgi:hypothetical protein